MEDNKLQPNTKFFSFEGFLGRRDYFLNMVFICAINTIVTLPYMTYLYNHISTLEDCFNFNKLFLNAPLLMQMWIILGAVGVCILSLSNIFRRLNDICAEKNTVIQTLCAVISVIGCAYFLLPLIVNCTVVFLGCIMGLILLFKRGKISSTLPYDFTKEFNWGAFLGTWLWGLFNKSYIPLWQLLVQFTPLSLYFKLYCGLKGNEWAYTNKKCTDVSEFNKSQEKQTIIFLIIYLVVVPILWILFIIGIVVLIIAIIGTLSVDRTSQEFSSDINSPSAIEQKVDKSDKFENSIDKFLNELSNLYFESHEITEDENKFYVSSKDWQSSSFKEKKNIIDMAANVSADERRKAFKLKHPNEYKSFTKSNELSRTKIYSAETKELLGEFSMELSENATPKEIFKSVLTSYKFYNPKRGKSNSHRNPM